MRVTKHQVGKKNKKHVTKKNRKSRNGKKKYRKMMKGGGNPLTEQEKENLRFLIIFCLGAIIAGVTIKQLISLFPGVGSTLIKLIYTLCELAFNIFKGTINLLTNSIPNVLISLVTRLSLVINTYCSATSASVATGAVATGAALDMHNKIANVGRSVFNINDDESYVVFANKIFGASLNAITESIIAVIDYCKQQTDYSGSRDFDSGTEEFNIFNNTTGEVEYLLTSRLSTLLNTEASNKEVNSTLSTMPILQNLQVAAGGGCSELRLSITSTPSEILDILNSDAKVKKKQEENLDKFKEYTDSKEFKQMVDEIKERQEGRRDTKVGHTQEEYTQGPTHSRKSRRETPYPLKRSMSLPISKNRK